MPKRGHGAYLKFGFGVSSAWGAGAVARTNSLEVTAQPGQRVRQTAPRPSLGLQGAVSTARRAGRHVVSDMHTGTLEFPVCYNDSSIALLMEALGGTGVVTTTGAGPYVHTAYLGGGADDQVPLTLELGRGGDGADLVDCALLNGMTLSITPGGTLMASIPYIGRTSVRGVVSVPTYVLGDLVLHKHCSTLAWNAAAFDMLSARIVLDRGLVARMLLGSEFTKRPSAGSEASVRFEIDVEAEADTLHAAYLADTVGDAVFSFTSGALGMEFTLRNAQLVNHADPISGTGIIKRTLVFEGQASGILATGSPLKVVVNNALATYRSNG